MEVPSVLYFVNKIQFNFSLFETILRIIKDKYAFYFTRM